MADTVKFKGSDLKVAADIQAGLTPTDQQVSANQSNIQADQRQIAANAKQIGANQQDIQANQKKIATNQADIIATNKRFEELGEYNILGEVTVYFGNGKVEVEQQYRPQLLALAQKAMTVNSYIIQVQGYASAVGSAALNQTLSMERADNVLTFLEEEGKVPLTNVLAPGAMGTNKPGRIQSNSGRTSGESPGGRSHSAEQGNRRSMTVLGRAPVPPVANDSCAARELLQV